MIQYHSCQVFVEDLTRSRDFYEGVLGQIVEMDFGRCVAFANGLTIMEKKYAPEVALGERGQGAAPIELYFECHELASSLARLKQQGAPIVHGIKEMPWRQQCLRIKDPDGNPIQIAEPMFNTIRRLIMAGESPKEVSEQTGVPEDLCEAFTGRGNIPVCEYDD